MKQRKSKLFCVLLIVILLNGIFSCIIPDYLDFKGGNSHNEFTLPNSYMGPSSEQDYPIAINLSGYNSGSSALQFNSYGGSATTIEGYYIPSSIASTDVVVIPFFLKEGSAPISDLRLIDINFSFTDTEYTYEGANFSASAPKTNLSSDSLSTLLAKKENNFAYPCGSVLYANGAYINCGVGSGESCFFVINLSSSGANKIKLSFTNAPFTQESFDPTKLKNDKYVATTINCKATLSSGTKTYLQPQAIVLPTAISAPSQGSLSFTITNSGSCAAQIEYEPFGFNTLFIFAKDGEKIIPRFVRSLQLSSSNFKGEGQAGFIESEKTIELTILDIPFDKLEATHCHLYLNFKDINPQLK